MQYVNIEASPVVISPKLKTKNEITIPFNLGSLCLRINLQQWKKLTFTEFALTPVNLTFNIYVKQPASARFENGMN